MSKSLYEISQEFTSIMKQLRELAKEADDAGCPFRGYITFDGNSVGSYEVSGGPEEYEESYDTSYETSEGCEY